MARKARVPGGWFTRYLVRAEPLLFNFYLRRSLVRQLGNGVGDNKVAPELAGRDECSGGGRV